MYKDLQAVILAGGRGKRLGSLGDKIPKAMVDINGVPFIELLINQLKSNNIKNFLILTGYRKKIIQKHFENKKNIKIYKGRINWKTLTRLIKAKKYIKNNFLLMYCDNYVLDYDLKKQIELQKKTKSNLVLSIVKKKNQQKGTIIKKKLKVYYKKGASTSLTEAGYILVKKKFFFNNVSKFNKKRDLSDYLGYLSNIYDFTGVNYKNNYLCIENMNLLKKTRNYFKNVNK